MPYQRLLLQAALLLALLAAGCVALFAAESACRAAWLPGDTGWTVRHLSGLVAARLVGALPADAAYCAGGPLAETVLALGGWLLPLLAAVLAAQVVYERFRHSMHRAMLARRGGHALVLGDAADISEVVRRERKAGAVLMLGRDSGGLAGLRRLFWSLPAVPLEADAVQLGAARARQIFALSSSDVANLNFVDSVRASAVQAMPKLTLRLENAAIRAAQRAGGSEIEDISLDLQMFRQGAALGDPGPLFARGIIPAHIMLVGAGARLGELALHLAGFGYGLERQAPQFTFLSLASGGVLPGVERIRSAPGLADVRSIALDRSDAVGLERAVADTLARSGPISAIHCIDDAVGEAYAAALVVAATLTAVKPAHKPKVIAYGRAGEATPSATLSALINFVGADDLATAIAEKERRDRMARAVHDAYLDLQRRTLGEAFGTSIAERAWQDLPMGFRDDNRAVADHIDHMLKARGLARGAAGRTAYRLTEDDIEAMAGMAHARWMAGKLVDGWRYAPERDNARRLHPSLVAYDALSEAEKDKDRDQIRSIPHILAILGEDICRAETTEGTVAP